MFEFITKYFKQDSKAIDNNSNESALPPKYTYAENQKYFNFAMARPTGGVCCACCGTEFKTHVDLRMHECDWTRKIE
jgi:hypothetical protein